MAANLDSTVLKSLTGRRHSTLCVLAVAAALGLTSAASAFPSWMGILGGYNRHDNNANPGKYTVFLNQDYYGLHAEVGVKVGSGSWTNTSMNYTGNVSGNSRWEVTPSATYPMNTTITHYFHGWDDWGGNIWDNNGSANYTFTSLPNWIGVFGTVVRHETGNPGVFNVLMNRDVSTISCELKLRLNGGSWTTYPMTYAGTVMGSTANSKWTCTPSGNFAPGTTVEYYFRGYDSLGGQILDNNGGANYTFTASLAPSTRAGMGAIPYATGTTFRVWAPNATNVTVTGSFNSWSATANPLAVDGTGGNWSVDVHNAVINDQYKYVITYGGTQYYRQDPRALDMTNSAGNSIIANLAYTWVNNSFTMPDWNNMVIYEMHVGTYNDTAGGNPGTFDNVTSKLQHLQDMGVNAIKVMPLMEFPGDTSWGYNPHSQYAPESIYGNPVDLKELVDAAHGKGIAVILDVVYNHMGTSPTESDIPIWNFDGPNLGNGGIYFYTDWKKQTPWGWSRPDYGRGEVRTYLRDSAFVWLNEYRVDGLRWDSTVNIRTQNNGGGGDIGDGWTLMQYINNDINSAAPWKISIAEDLQNNDWITKTTGAGGAGFDSQWDSGFVHPIRTAVIASSDSSRDMNAVKGAIEHKYNGQGTQRVIYTESHDEVNNGHSRVPEEIWPGNASSWYSKKRSTLGAAIAFTSPGIPMIFMGQEMLEDGFWSDTDPIDWAKATTYSGIVTMYRDMIRYRRNWYSNTNGLKGDNVNVHHVNNTNKVIAYHRWLNGGNGDDCIVVANFSGSGFSSYNIGFPSSGTWYVRFNSDWSGYDSSFGNWNSYNTTAVSGAKDGMGYNANVGIGPYSLIILSK